MINEIIKNRHSYRSLSTAPIPPQQITDMLEAFRWAPSAKNAQPWQVVVTNGQKLLPALSKGNAAWAGTAPVAYVVCAVPASDPKPGRENNYLFDAGLAAENLMLQATAFGLTANPTAGWDEDQIKKICAIPENVKVVCIIFVGKSGRPEDVDQITQSKLNTPRTRKEISEVAHQDTWGESFK